MTTHFFKFQINRLVTRFGSKAFDAEFIALVWREVKDLSEPGFLTAVNVWLGSRRPNDPPLLTEFREARIFEQKNKFRREANDTHEIILRKSPQEMRAHLQKIKDKMKAERI